jgi:hypothetical protein
MDDIFCNLCGNLVTVPLSLDCGHVLCKECVLFVRDWDAVRHIPRRKLCCPMVGCKKETRFGRTELKVDETTLQNLKDYLDSVQRVPVCAECGEHSSAVYCLNCCTHLCEGCRTSVHSAKVLSHHKLVEAAEVPIVPPRKCSKHDKEMTYFCNKCAVLTCESCARFGFHREHGAVPALENVDKIRRDMAVELKEAQPFVARVKEGSDQATAQSQEIQESRNAILEDIRASFSGMRARLDIKELSLIDEVRSHLDAGENAIAEQAQHLTALHAGYTRFMESAKSSLSSRDPLDIVSRYAALKRVMTEYSAIEAVHTAVADVPVIRLRSGDLDELDAIANKWCIDVVGAPAAGAEKAPVDLSLAPAAAATKLPQLPAPQVAGENGDYRLTWHTVVLPADLSRAGIVIKYELLLDGEKIVYSGTETSLAVKVPAGSPVYRISARYTVGNDCSPWSPPVELHPERPTGFANLSPGLVSALKPMHGAISNKILVRILLWGAGGAGGGYDASGNYGGAGGFATAVYEAEAGEKFTVVVGAGGTARVVQAGGAPNGGDCNPSMTPAQVLGGGGGGSTHVVSMSKNGDIILGSGGGGGGAATHLYAGSKGVGGGGGGGTLDGKVGVGGTGGGLTAANSAVSGTFGAGGGGASPASPPGGSNGGAAGGNAACAGNNANGAGGQASRTEDDGGERGEGRRGGGGGGGRASSKHCVEGSFKTIDARGAEPVTLPGEESEGAGRGGCSGCGAGQEGRAVIIFPNGKRVVYDVSGAHELVIA